MIDTSVFASPSVCAASIKPAEPKFVVLLVNDETGNVVGVIARVVCSVVLVDPRDHGDEHLLEPQAPNRCSAGSGSRPAGSPRPRLRAKRGLAPHVVPAVAYRDLGCACDIVDRCDIGNRIGRNIV